MERPELTADEVADYFLASVDADAGDNLSNLKLQKLIYYAQGFHLAMFEKPLFDEPIEAWTYGPVVPRIYRKYKDHGSGGIPAPREFDDRRFDPETRGLLDEVMEVYGQYSAVKLMNMTHEDLPWKCTPSAGVIDREQMRKYFKKLLINGQK